MAIIQQFYDAWDSQDIETVDRLTHENFIAWSHSGNKGFTKEEWMSWISPDFPKAEKLRIAKLLETNKNAHDLLKEKSLRPYKWTFGFEKTILGARGPWYVSICVYV